MVMVLDGQEFHRASSEQKMGSETRDLRTRGENSVSASWLGPNLQMQLLFAWPCVVRVNDGWRIYSFIQRRIILVGGEVDKGLAINPTHKRVGRVLGSAGNSLILLYLTCDLSLSLFAFWFNAGEAENGKGDSMIRREFCTRQNLDSATTRMFTSTINLP